VNRPAAPRRPPALALVSSGLALAVLAVLAVAVARYLTAPADHAMHGMGTAQALSRASAGKPLRPLLGSALLSAWQLDALAVAVVVLLAAWYLTAVALVPVRSPGLRWPASRTASFLAGLAVCVFATNGSIAVYDQVLFSAHMIGHLALVMLAPALLMAGRPLTLALAAARRPGGLRRVLAGRVLAVVTAPPVALACYAVVIVGSHLTGAMDSIMRSTWAGQVEHLVYLVVGCQFFVLITGDEPLRWRLSTPVRWLLLAVAMAVDTFTGIVLLQGTSAVAMLPDPALAVDALSDTRTGGAIMWFGGDGLMAAIMIVLVVGWLRRTDGASAGGWLDQARRSAFAEHSVNAEADSVPEDLDEDDAARASYNAWLASLDRNS
jgi:cytochrome c oxidase assembly factor CtaG